MFLKSLIILPRYDTMQYIMYQKKLLTVMGKAIPSLIVDFAPIIAFIIVAKGGRVYTATLVLMMATIVTTVVIYSREKRLPYLTLYITFITIIFGTFTITKHHVSILQLRDTLYDLSLALLLILGMFFDALFLKMSFEKVVHLSDGGWKKLTYLWTLFFLVTAGVNEYIRRYDSFRTWLHYKEWLILITIIFGLSTFVYAYLTTKHHEE